MTFEIFYDNHPEKFVSKLDRHMAKRLVEKIEETLGNNPVPQNSVAIKDEHGVFRIRIGKIRILYRINYNINKIIILKIDFRSKVYD